MDKKDYIIQDLQEKLTRLRDDNFNLRMECRNYRERLMMCKRDNKIRRQRHDALMQALLNDKSIGKNGKTIFTKTDLLWNASDYAWRVLAGMVQAYFKTGMVGMPENMTEEEFDRRKELMIQACVIKSAEGWETNLKPQHSKEEQEIVELGIKYLIEYLPHMWL